MGAGLRQTKFFCNKMIFPLSQGNTKETSAQKVTKITKMRKRYHLWGPCGRWSRREVDPGAAALWPRLVFEISSTKRYSAYADPPTRFPRSGLTRTCPGRGFLSPRFVFVSFVIFCEKLPLRANRDGLLTGECKAGRLTYRQSGTLC